ncbi:MAG: hypothetical protein NWP69_06545, partial [Congregibacter sp.]|nr:hypothetical protein [Congregibacter sp.]
MAALSLAMLGGCVSSTQIAGSTDTAAPQSDLDAAEATANKDLNEDSLAPPVIERPIPPDSMYPLLLAEFALRRRDFDTALNTYLEQA